MNQDMEHIKILSIFHFVVAGIAGLVACFPIIHLVVGISMLAGGFSSGEASSNSALPFALFGLMFTLIPLLIIFLGWAFAICLAISGYFLMNKRHYMFCLIMAGISCIFTPFGTVLGVFSIVVLTRPSVKQLFDSTSTRI